MTCAPSEHRWVEQGKGGDKPDPSGARRVYCETCKAKGWQPRGRWQVVVIAPTKGYSGGAL